MKEEQRELLPTLTLRRYSDDGTRTLGRLKDYYTLERPWKNNEPNVSCIPAKMYLVKPDSTGKHRYFRVVGVEGRSAIELHVANRVEEILGCIAVGLAVNKSGNAIMHSRAAMEELKRKYPRGFYLDIKDLT